MILLTQQINKNDNPTRANGQTKAKRYTEHQPTGNGYDDFNSEYEWTNAILVRLTWKMSHWSISLSFQNTNTKLHAYWIMFAVCSWL